MGSKHTGEECWVFLGVKIIDQDGIVACVGIFIGGLIVMQLLPIIVGESVGSVDASARCAGLLRSTGFSLFCGVIKNEFLGFVGEIIPDSLVGCGDALPCFTVETYFVDFTLSYECFEIGKSRELCWMGDGALSADAECCTIAKIWDKCAAFGTRFFNVPVG